MDTEWLKSILPPAAILGAAAVAWLTRRAERLRDSYAEWATAVFQAVAIRRKREPQAVMGMDSHVPNPQWIDWNKAWRESSASLRSSRALLYTREPSSKLRAIVDGLSSFPSETDLSAREAEVEQLIAAVSTGTWLILGMRSIEMGDLNLDANRPK